MLIQISAGTAYVHAALLSAVTLPGLTSPEETLKAVTSSKPAKSFKALEADSVLRAASLFACIAVQIPMEFLTKKLRVELVERALSIDVGLSSGYISVEDASNAQRSLRAFVAVASSSQAMSSVSLVVFSLYELRTDICELLDSPADLMSSHTSFIVLRRKSG